MRIWSTWGLGRGLHVPNVLRTPNCIIWLSLRRLGENNDTSVKLVHHVIAPCATNKPQVCYRNHIATVTRWATGDLPTVVPLTFATHKDSVLTRTQVIYFLSVTPLHTQTEACTQLMHLTSMFNPFSLHMQSIRYLPVAARIIAEVWLPSLKSCCFGRLHCSM